jgi:hypothetical protein
MRMKRQGIADFVRFDGLGAASPASGQTCHMPERGVRRSDCHPGRQATENVGRSFALGIQRPLQRGNPHIGSQVDNTQALVSVTYGRRVPRNRRELYYEEGFLRYSKGPARRSPKTYLATVHYDDQWPGAGVVTAPPPRPTSADVGATQCTLEPGPPGRTLTPTTSAQSHGAVPTTP